MQASSRRVNGARIAGLMFVPFAFAAACASTLPPDRGARHPLTASTPHDAGTASVDAGIQPNAVMDARLSEYERFHDWRSTVYVTGTPSDEPIFRAAHAMPKRASADPRVRVQWRLREQVGVRHAVRS